MGNSYQAMKREIILEFFTQISKRFCVYLKLNHPALGVILEGVQYSCKRLAEHDSGFGQARTAGCDPIHI